MNQQEQNWLIDLYGEQLRTWEKTLKEAQTQLKEARNEVTVLEYRECQAKIIVENLTAIKTSIERALASDEEKQSP